MHCTMMSISLEVLQVVAQGTGSISAEIENVYVWARAYVLLLTMNALILGQLNHEKYSSGITRPIQLGKPILFLCLFFPQNYSLRFTIIFFNFLSRSPIQMYYPEHLLMNKNLSPQMNYSHLLDNPSFLVTNLKIMNFN